MQYVFLPAASRVLQLVGNPGLVGTAFGRHTVKVAGHVPCQRILWEVPANIYTVARMEAEIEEVSFFPAVRAWRKLADRATVILPKTEAGAVQVPRPVQKQATLAGGVVRADHLLIPTTVDHLEAPALCPGSHLENTRAAKVVQIAVRIERRGVPHRRPVRALRETLTETVQNGLGPLSPRAGFQLKHRTVAVGAAPSRPPIGCRSGRVSGPRRRRHHPAFPRKSAGYYIYWPPPHVG